MNTPEQVFAAAFNRLRRRFNLGPDDEQAGDYYRYLSGVLTLEETLAAMQALWATREFFPRPADFVLAFAPAEWRKVQDCMERWHEEDSRKALLAALSPRTLAACRALGGPGDMRLQADVLRLRQAFEREYVNAVQSEAMTLPVWTEPAALAGRRHALPGERIRIGSGNP